MVGGPRVQTGVRFLAGEPCFHIVCYIVLSVAVIVVSICSKRYGLSSAVKILKEYSDKVFCVSHPPPPS